MKKSDRIIRKINRNINLFNWVYHELLSYFFVKKQLNKI